MGWEITTKLHILSTGLNKPQEWKLVIKHLPILKLPGPLLLGMTSLCMVLEDPPPVVPPSTTTPGANHRTGIAPANVHTKKVIIMPLQWNWTGWKETDVKEPQNK